MLQVTAGRVIREEHVTRIAFYPAADSVELNTLLGEVDVHEEFQHSVLERLQVPLTADGRLTPAEDSGFINFNKLTCLRRSAVSGITLFLESGPLLVVDVLGITDVYDTRDEDDIRTFLALFNRAPAERSPESDLPYGRLL